MKNQINATRKVLKKYQEERCKVENKEFSLRYILPKTKILRTFIAKKLPQANKSILILLDNFISGTERFKINRR